MATNFPNDTNFVLYLITKAFVQFESFDIIRDFTLLGDGFNITV